MPTRYTLRIQFSPLDDPDDVARQLLALAREARLDEVMVFFYAEELNDGHDAPERVALWLDRTRPARRALRAAGVDVSLNPWHTMLHCDRGRRLKPGQDWRPMVSPEGIAASAVVCPLDPGWRAYYAGCLERYAREGFRIVWLDDDIRLHNHGIGEWGGCFCPLHVAEFNRRTGAGATREEIVRACTAPGAPHPWRGAWLDMWQDTLLEMVAGWRAIVEPHGVRLGLMSSGIDTHSAEGRRWPAWWGALAGGHQPAHRPHFWGYSDMAGLSLPYCMAHLDQNRCVQPDDIESGPEIECFPYGRWNKSFRQTGAQMALAHVLGSTGLNVSLHDFMGNRPDDEPDRNAFLAAWRPALDRLADLFPMSLRSAGVGILWSPDAARSLRTNGSGRWGSLIPKSLGWAGWLGAAGLAFSMRPPGAVAALGGDQAWALAEEDLRTRLAAGLLLDGPAAAALAERGLGPLIGVGRTRWISQDEAVYSMEQCLDPAFSFRVGGRISVNAKPFSRRLFQAELADGARAVSDLRTPLQDVVGHGAYIFENALGGRVACVPWDSNGGLEMGLHRAVQLRRLAAWLAAGPATGSVSGAPWLVPQFLAGGGLHRAAIWNAGPDAAEGFELEPPAGFAALRGGFHLDARGEMRPVTVRGGAVRLAAPLHQWELVVLTP